MHTINQISDIVLILPPKRFKEHRYSLGLMYIAGYLRANSFDSLIIDSQIFGEHYEYNHERARNDIIKKLVEIQPKIIGFTATTIEAEEVIKINSAVKSQIQTISVVGGPHATACPQEMNKNGFDAVVIGEGEETFLQLVKMIDNNDCQWEKINGLAWEKDGEVIINPARELVDISKMPLPAYDKVNMKYYGQVWDDVIRGFPIKAAMVMASRGCPYSCSFCACNKVFGRKVRYRDLGNIKEEVKLLRDDYGIEGIWFADDTLTVSYDHVEKICEIMKALKMYWGAQSRVDLTSEEIIKLMAGSGCLQLDFGVESGNQRVLDEVINKRIKLTDVEKSFALCRKYGIRTQASFMIGLPTETKAEMEETFQFAMKIKPDSYSFNVLTPLPGTEIYNNYFAGKIGLVDYENTSFHKTKALFNQSQVKDVNALHDQWRARLYEGVKLRSLGRSFNVFRLWFKLGNKKERLYFIWFKLRRAIKYLLNKFGFNFLIQ